MTDAPTKHLECNECGAPVTSPVPQSTITTAYLLCPDCLEAIPDDIANQFFEHAAKRAKALKEEATMTDAIGTVTMYPKLERREWIFGTAPDPRDARIAELEAALKVIGALTMTPGAMSCVAISQIVNDALMPAPERDMTITQEAMDA